MNRECYGLVVHKKNNMYVTEVGKTEDYTRYCSYLIWLAKENFGITNSKQFSQWYYRLYYNPDWKYNQQYYNENRSVVNTPWFDSKLDDELYGWSNRIQYTIGSSFDKNIGFSLAKVMLDNSKIKSYENESISEGFVVDVITNVRIKYVIKPSEIWNKFSNNHTYEKHNYDDSYYISLYTLCWVKK